MIVDRVINLAGAVLAVLALAATGWILTLKLTEAETASGPGLIVMPASLGGPFELTDHRGQPVSDVAFADRPTLLYFGYTYCPDVCPLSLQTMATVLAKDESAINAAFVTIDPERDTVAHLADYMPLFHEEMVGLTGTAVEIEPVAKRFRVYFRHRKDIDSEMYPVDHSSYIYLMDADWRLVAVFRHDATADEIRVVLEPHL